MSELKSEIARRQTTELKPETDEAAKLPVFFDFFIEDGLPGIPDMTLPPPTPRNFVQAKLSNLEPS